MRIAFIIAVLAAIGLTMVQIVTARRAAEYECIKLNSYLETEVPRRLWDQQVEMSQLTAPAQVRKRSEEMALQLVDKDKKTGLAAGDPNTRR